MFARCTRVLRKSDSCPGEKLMNNMSAMPNSSTTARTCSTREPSWAEDFIDLSEFCQPSTIPTRMEDRADECIASPVSSSVRTHCFDNGLDGNDGLDPCLEETLWYMPSPSSIQAELCGDPLTDWLVSTKETMSGGGHHEANLLPSSRTEISYNLNDMFLSPRLAPVPMSAAAAASSLYDRKPMAFDADDSQTTTTTTSPLQPDTTFFHSSADAALDRRLHQLHAGGLLSDALKAPAMVRLPPADLLFKEKQQSPPQPPPPPLPSISTLPSTKPSALGAFQLRPQTLATRNQFLERKAEIAPVTVDASASFPCTVQSPSITQSSGAVSSHSSEPGHPVAAPTATRMRRATKLDVAGCQSPANSSTSPCTIGGPEMLSSLGKNTDFDLVSFVFEDNKSSVSFDLSNLSSSTQDDDEQQQQQQDDDEQQQQQLVAAEAKSSGPTPPTAAQSSVTIKSEPKEESASSAAAAADDPSGQPQSALLQLAKRKFKDEDDEDTGSVCGGGGGSSSSGKLKRSRRFSNCSSEDLTQLESEKYRELRNKNNEASRRSRANRKNREVEMREHAFKLDAENRRLKFKAEEMEKLVKRLRNCLMQLVLKRG